MEYTEPEIVRHKAKKDTKTWCRGRVGVKHDYGEPYNLFPQFRLGFQIWQSVCSRCGKKHLESRKAD